MKNLYLTFFFLVCSNISLAQIAFTVTPDSIDVTKPITFDLFYDYALFVNNTSDSLFMRWKKVHLEMTATGAHGGGWDLSILDPSNFYPSANAMDSADFVLAPIAAPDDKFILQVAPDGEEGTLIAKFIFYPINNPSDTAVVIINYEATPVTSTQEIAVRKIIVTPNPATDVLEITNRFDSAKRIRLVNSSGKICWKYFLEKEETKMVSINHLPTGIYFLMYENKNESFVHKIIVQ